MTYVRLVRVSPFDRDREAGQPGTVSRSSRPLRLDAAPGGPPPAERDEVLDVVRDAKDGNPDAVGRFLLVIAPWVRRTCIGVMGADHPDLDDTMQECLLAAVRALAKYRFDGDIRHYVAKITLRLAIAARQSSASRTRNHDLIARAGPGLEVAPQTPASEQWSSDEIGMVRHILYRLSAVQSEALLMRIVLGFTVEEIGRMTGVSQNTVKKRIRLGKEALRKNYRKTSLLARWLGRKRRSGTKD